MGRDADEKPKYPPPKGAGGGYTVTVSPSGRFVDEAMAREAIRLYIEHLLEYTLT